MSSTWQMCRERSNGMFGTKYWAVGPGCPLHGHAIRNCECRPFKTPREAKDYIARQLCEGEDNQLSL